MKYAAYQRYLRIKLRHLSRVSLSLRLISMLILGLWVHLPSEAQAASRIKDVVYFEGVRDNLLVGYGLVVGLNGTGDNLKNAAFTEKGLVDLLNRLGVSTKGTQLKTKNVAAVTVTAKLPPFSRQGSHIDISVSTLGDAKSLEGGVLLATPLLGADGEVYAVAQGQVAIGGFQASAGSEVISKGVPTTGFVANGAIIEREIDFALAGMESLNLALRNPDISTARQIAEAINELVGASSAKALDPGTVKLTVPELYEDNIVGLLADVEQIMVEPDQPARIVIDEGSGTIVMGENVRIDTVAVAQGNLVVSITESTAFSQPTAFSGDNATTAEAQEIDVNVSEEPGRKMAMLSQGASLRDLVTGLNSLGVGPRDLITILQTIKAAGALQAEIETR